MSQLNNHVDLSELKQQAIDWLVCLRSDDISDDELCAFAEWLAQDHANSEAFSSAEILFDQMSIAVIQNEKKNTTQPISSPFLTPKTQLKKEKQPAKPYNRLFIPTFAIAATCLLVTFLFFPQKLHLLDKLLSDYHTQIGELREIKLSDGSRLLLNTNSAVSVNYSKTARTITLHHGQVRFTVASEISRPFEVLVGNLNVRALGTIFQVHKPDKDKVKIIVQEHAIAVSLKTDINNSEQPTSITVQKGEQLLFKSAKSLPLPRSIELQHATAWQKQRLIINDQPLGDLIVELERYQNGSIFISDNDLKNLRITGVFSLKNPQEILNKICKVLDLKQTHIGRWSILSR